MTDLYKMVSSNLSLFNHSLREIFVLFMYKLLG